MAKVAVADEAPSRRRILIIEDHVETRILYGEHFQRVGYEAETAESGNAGMAAALRTRPDVILLDLAMPSLDGWATVALLRMYPSTATIPAIACTAVEDPEELARASSLGCNAIVKKPCLPSDLE